MTVTLHSPGFVISGAVNCCQHSRIKQDDPVDLQLGHYIMIITTPPRQMAALLALRLNRSNARVHYCECVVQFVCRCETKTHTRTTKINSLQAFIPLNLGRRSLIYGRSPASPGPRRRVFTLMPGLLPGKWGDEQHLAVSGDTSAAGSFQSPQFDGIDSDKENFAAPLRLLSRQFVAVWSEAAGCIDVTPCPGPGPR